MRNKRKKVWIDRFQTQLSLRLAFYFIIYMIFVWAFVYVQGAITERVTLLAGGRAAFYTWIVLTTMVVGLGFLFIRDSIMVAHRLVGPLHRFQKTIKAITAGETLDPVMLRKNDYLQELKDDFNEMLRILQQRGAIVLRTAAGPKPEPNPNITSLPDAPGSPSNPGNVRPPH